MMLMNYHLDRGAVGSENTVLAAKVADHLHSTYNCLSLYNNVQTTLFDAFSNIYICVIQLFWT